MLTEHSWGCFWNSSTCAPSHQEANCTRSEGCRKGCQEDRRDTTPLNQANAILLVRISRVRADNRLIVVHGACRQRPGFYMHTKLCASFPKGSKPMTADQYKTYKKKAKSVSASKSKGRSGTHSAPGGGTGSQHQASDVRSQQPPGDESSSSDDSQESVSATTHNTLQSCHSDCYT